MFDKNQIPWNKGLRGIKTSKKGQVAWNKELKNWRPGYRHSQKTINKISEAHKKIGTPWLIGKKLSEEHKIKLSLANKGKHTGHIPWNKGKTGVYSQETICKMRAKLKGRISPNKGKKGIVNSGGFKKGHKGFGPNKGQFTKERMGGAGHHNWKGGITPVNLKIRYSLKYKLWRGSCF